MIENAAENDAGALFVRPDVTAFLRYLNSVPGPKMHELPPAEARAAASAQEAAEAPATRGAFGQRTDASAQDAAGAPALNREQRRAQAKKK